MIEKIKLLHHLSESTYGRICESFGLDTQKSKGNFVCFEGQKITRIDLYHIVYVQWGHMWFMETTMDFPKFACPYDAFGPKLMEEYGARWDAEIMADFPAFDALICTYIEFSDVLEVNNADERLWRLSQRGKLDAEQLDRARWGQVMRPPGTFQFMLGKEDDTHVIAFARGNGTAFRQRVKDRSFHRPAGITAPKAVDEDTGREIMAWLYNKYGVLK